MLLARVGLRYMIQLSVRTINLRWTEESLSLSFSLRKSIGSNLAQLQPDSD